MTEAFEKLRLAGLLPRAWIGDPATVGLLSDPRG